MRMHVCLAHTKPISQCLHIERLCLKLSISAVLFYLPFKNVCDFLYLRLRCWNISP